VKDGGRNIGRSIGVPEDLLTRHPFPGPGLVVRIDGEVNAQSLAIAREVDRIYIEELRRWNLYYTVWQVGAVVTNTTTTCTKGDDAVKGIVIIIWAVWSVNGFTAQAAELPNDFLKHVDRRITNEIREVGATAYRLTGKPPSTIEIG
jgi:GMP synthase (glutamine-hydrolysing)